MATKQANRGLQYPLVHVFEFDVLDTMATTAGVEQAFKTAAGVYEIMLMPGNYQVIGGDITVVTASTETGTATMSVGDSGSATRYANAVNIKAAARTALTLTGLQLTGGQNIRITLANQNGDAAAGKVRITLMYILPTGRAHEVQTH
jgi:hypothetical protein